MHLRLLADDVVESRRSHVAHVGRITYRIIQGTFGHF